VRRRRRGGSGRDREHRTGSAGVEAQRPAGRRRLRLGPWQDHPRPPPAAAAAAHLRAAPAQEQKHDERDGDAGVRRSAHPEQRPSGPRRAHPELSDQLAARRVVVVEEAVVVALEDVAIADAADDPVQHDAAELAVVVADRVADRIARPRVEDDEVAAVGAAVERERVR